MTTWQPRLAMEEELKRLEVRLAATPDDADLCFDHAYLLNQMGRYEEARIGYYELLKKDPSHFGALNNLGVLYNTVGFVGAACMAWEETVKHHPDSTIAHINLGHAYAKTNHIDEAKQHFETALRLEPHHVAANQGYAFLLYSIGERELARTYHANGFAGRPITIYPYRGDTIPIVLLVLSSADGGCVPIMHHLDERVFFISVLFTEYYDATLPFPPHQLVFNAIGDADLSQPGLAAAKKILERTNAPIINSPTAVMPTSRAGNAARLAGLPGVITPKMITLTREKLMHDDITDLLKEHGFAFPLLLRPPGFHTGNYFHRVENAEQLAVVLPQMPGEELLVIEYIDTRAADGKIRKYRVMMIDGTFFPLHAAISADWKIHYFSADMADNPEHLAEDERFLYHMSEVLGPRAMQALQHIHDTLGLEYAGVDFGLTSDGDLIVYEANAVMVVNPVGEGTQWDYRRLPVQRIIGAIRQMIVRRVKPGQLAKITPELK